MQRRISSQLCVITTSSSRLAALPLSQAGSEKEGAVAAGNGLAIDLELNGPCNSTLSPSFVPASLSLPAARCATTKASNSELLANRLAPCSPVQPTSPAAN